MKTKTNDLEGKYILIVEDESDVIAAMRELLSMCRIDSAESFEKGEKLLHQNQYDIAVLDIMGVDGYRLLEIAHQKNIPALMLTAHALNPDNFFKSMSKGAGAYIPKEKMSEIAYFILDVLNEQPGDQKPGLWFSRLKNYFESRFGKGWIDEYRKMRESYEKKYGRYLYFE
jgi:response regulator RpfG family c-di-GMP phosphodiesterase